MNMKSLFALALALAAGSTLAAVPKNSVWLVRGGKAQAHVVVEAGDSLSVTNAAAALRHWTKEKTGADLDGATPIRFRLVDAAADLGFKYDGFRVDASEKAIVISAKVPRAFEFAVHYLLNRYAEIDWFHPESGADFERSDDFAIPAGTLVRTPPRWREGIIPGNPKKDPEASRRLVADWNVRNGFYGKYNRMGGHVIGEWLLWTPVDEAEYKREFENIRTNFTGIFKSRPATDSAMQYARWKILVKQHPDWFALVDGKRVPCGQFLIGNGNHNYMHRSAMPCLSNPEVREQMLKNYLDRRHDPKLWYAPMKEICFSIICDDQPCWCECDNCMKLITHKGTKGGEGKASDYYWDFVNWIAPRMLEADPTLTVNAYAYQSHRAFPTRVKPQPFGDRLNVVVCSHGRCHLHALTDASCPANVPVRQMLEQWTDAGFPALTFEYMCQTPGMCDYFFWERTWVEDLKWYAKHNVGAGTGGLIGPWFGFYGSKYFFDQNGAKARWFTAYLTSHFDWDTDDDFDAVCDRMLRKYYRSAAKPMAAYHKYLESKLYDAGICMPYHDTEMGSHDLFSQAVAGRPGVLEPARKLLAAAKRAAKDDSLALERIAWDEKYFKVEWEEAAGLIAKIDAFQNGSFENVTKPGTTDGNGGKWKFLSKDAPKDWSFHVCGGVAELVTGGAADGERFLRLKPNETGSQYIIHTGLRFYPENTRTLKVSFKARGKAKLRVFFRRGSCKKDVVWDVDVNSRDWQTFSRDLNRETDGIPDLFFIYATGDVDLDACTARPML